MNLYLLKCEFDGLFDDLAEEWKFEILKKYWEHETPENKWWRMDEFDEVFSKLKPHELVELIDFTFFSTNDDYFTIDDFGKPFSGNFEDVMYDTFELNEDYKDVLFEHPEWWNEHIDESTFLNYELEDEDGEIPTWLKQ